MSTNACYYHPERKAVTNCARCQRPICAEDIRYQFRGYGRINGHNQPPLCFVCFASQMPINKKVSTFGSLIISALIFAVIFGLAYFTGFLGNFSFSALQNSGSSSVNSRGPDIGSSFLNSQSFILLIFIFLIVVFIGILLHLKFQSHKEIDEAYTFKKTMEFQDKNNTSDYMYPKIKTSFKPLTAKRNELARGTCYNCGAYLDKDDRFCPNCGKNND